MIAEDVEVIIQISKNKTPVIAEGDSLKDKDKDKDDKDKTAKSYPICKSSWITHLMTTNNQVYSSVRDYIVSSDRIGSLLKQHNASHKSQINYLLRIRTKTPFEEICA